MLGLKARRKYIRVCLFLVLFAFLRATHAQTAGAGWLISPVLKNMTVGDVVELQILDNGLQEISADRWSVSDTGILELRTVGKRISLRALRQGDAVITAKKGKRIQNLSVTVWQELPAGTALWKMPVQFGRLLKEHATAPSDDGPEVYTLHSLGSRLFVRALTKNGILLWSWHPTDDVTPLTLVCGDDKGGTIVAMQGKSGFSLLNLNSHGKVQWTYSSEGQVDAYTFGDTRLLIAEASRDHQNVTIVAIDPEGGVAKSRYELPASGKTILNGIEREGKIECMPGNRIDLPMQVRASQLFTDGAGNAYVAFTKRFLSIEAPNCSTDSTIRKQDLQLHRDYSLMLMRISPEGDSTLFTVEEQREDAVPAWGHIYPMTGLTGEIIPDGEGGALISVRVSYGDVFSKKPLRSEDFIYRVTNDGILVYRFRLPSHSGDAHDTMVLGDHHDAFVTRGSVVVCFDSITGEERWRYDTGVDGIQVGSVLEDEGVMVSGPGQAIYIQKHATRVDRLTVEP